MEQIIRKDGRIYYGERCCRDADDAYCHFRDDYHVSLGKRAYKRLNRLGQRKERVHDNGFSFSHPVHFERHDGRACETVGVRLLGLVETAYCRGLGRWDMPCEDDEFEQWFDWAFSRGSGAVRLVVTRDCSGRTSKRLKTRYR